MVQRIRCGLLCNVRFVVRAKFEAWRALEQQHQNQCLHKAMALPLDKLNKLLRTAALGVEVVQTATKGRGIIATRAHRAGAAVVPAGEPLAHSSKRAVNAFAGHGEFAGTSSA